MEMLCFRLPGHGDSTLRHINLLRSRQHFCDVTIIASDNQMFRGHKVVLAACSPFLRDQFLLNPSSKLQVSMLHSSTVVCNLLQSCYTGMLQFNPEEIVNYLTAASYLQMEHIVERCRGALKKYMKHRTPSPPKIKTESLSTPVIVSGSAASVASMSPPTGRDSPAQRSSPTGGSLDGRPTDRTGRASDHHGNGALLDESCIKVDASDEEMRQDYDVFSLYAPEEEEQGAAARRGHEEEEEGEERDGPSDGTREAPYSQMDADLGGEVGGVGGEFGLDPAEQELEMSGFPRDALSVAGLRALRRRFPEPKAGRARERGRGRGFKRRKWASSQERRPVGPAHHHDLWYPGPSGMGGAFGVEYGRDGLNPASYLPAVDLPQIEFSVGEAQADEGGVMARFALEESPGAGEGGSGLGAGPAEAGGDESVAVVGSTSSAAGPVICEHCGMTFPSPHSLALHARSSHLLYACPCCGKHFQSAPSLTRHMAVHRGAGKTHQCPLCYKTFTQKSTLIDHMNLHSGERPHRCAYCHARFAHKPALRRHLKEQHGKTTGQNSLHEQEEREREQLGAGEAGKAIREEEHELLINEQLS